MHCDNDVFSGTKFPVTKWDFEANTNSTVDKMGPHTKFLYCLRTQLSNPSVKSQRFILTQKVT